MRTTWTAKACRPSADDLREQEALAVRVRDLLSQARRAADRIERALETAPEDSERRRRLDAVRSLLLEEEGVTYPRPMMVDQLEYLYSMVTRGDQSPPATPTADTTSSAPRWRASRGMLYAAISR